MTTTSHRTRLALLALLLLSLEFLLFTRPAHGGWSAEPVQVHATTALCPLVSASDDSHYGAIVVWQENTASGGLLKARHLLATGDVDPSWNAPTLLSTAQVSRAALGSVADGVGGAYVWWMENALLYLTRVAADGTIGTGWPARGRQIGSLIDSNSRPVAVADGSGGLYLGWLTRAQILSDQFVVRAAHLGPDNTGQTGWGNGVRVLGSTLDFSETVNAFGLAAAPDGGLWLAFATTSIASPGVYAAGDVRIARYTASGMPEAGWDAHGVSVAPFRGDLLVDSPNWGLAPPMRLAAVASDDAGGAFVLFGDVWDSQGSGIVSNYRLQRVDVAGANAPGWPAGGRQVPGGAWHGQSASTSLVLHSDLTGGAFSGQPMFFDHGVSYDFTHFSAAGDVLPGGFAIGGTGVESGARGDGGIVAASFFPSGPSGPFQPSAYLQVDQTDPGASFTEYHAEPVIEWYGDIGLSATGDGGSIFAWSQVNERFGVFAIRLNPSGIVTGVPPGSAGQRLRLWYARGSGVQVEAPAGLVSLALHDVTGRVAARGTSDASGSWTLPGTAGLPSGVYFAHAKWSDRDTHARVVVIR